jgi:hypothetical protein
MVELLPPPPEILRNALESVLEGVIGAGATAPGWVAVDDGSGAWIAKCAASSPTDRARGVLAAASDEALVAGRRLGVGGAMMVPPSTLGAREALEAAAAAPAPTGFIDPALLETLEAGAGLHIVSFADRAFWRSQLGDRALLTLLGELAAALDAAPATVPWPALAIAGRDRDDIERAWDDVVEGSGADGASLIVTGCEWPEDGDRLRAISELLISATNGVVAQAVKPQPVHELPSGDPLGWWAPRVVATLPTGWLATPGETTGSGRGWVLRGGQGGVVAEVLLHAEVEAVADERAVRVPGWVTIGLRSGTPAGLLVQRLAESAARRGVPLWVPNLDAEALRFVLRLPGTLWVDGPAVPR